MVVAILCAVNTFRRRLALRLGLAGQPSRPQAGQLRLLLVVVPADPSAAASPTLITANVVLAAVVPVVLVAVYVAKNPNLLLHWIAGAEPDNLVHKAVPAAARDLLARVRRLQQLLRTPPV